jgi:hypothetical protein
LRESVWDGVDVDVDVDVVVRARVWVRGGRTEELPYASGEVAFEAAECFEFGFALGVFACKVGAGFWIGLGA